MKLGNGGEKIAKDYMINKGYDFLAENYRYDRAETDLIFKKDKEKLIVFMEVKTRTSSFFAEPEDSITERKQGQMVKSAEGFLSANEEYEGYERRFDVMAIIVKGKETKINHLENIF